MRFTMRNWTIDSDWITPMKEVHCLGSSFYAHLMDSMNILVSSFGSNLRTQANLITNVNAPDAKYSFSAQHMTKYLQNGDFKFGTTSTDILVIRGPNEQNLIDNVNGSALINGREINIHFYRYANLVHENLNGWFPESAAGLNALKTLLGKLILHEMLHCEGFQHPDHPGSAYNPSLVYWRTFPEVAEEAYNRFRGNLPQGAFNLVGDKGEVVRNCGTFS